MDYVRRIHRFLTFESSHPQFKDSISIADVVVVVVVVADGHTGIQSLNVFGTNNRYDGIPFRSVGGLELLLIAL